MQNFQWDGRSANGVKNADGNYTMVITAKDTSGNAVAISTQVSGIVDSVDLNADPADAADRRPELHHGQDQESRAAGPLSGLPSPKRYLGRYLFPISL